MTSLITIETVEEIRASWSDLDIRKCPIRRSWKEIFDKIFNQQEVKKNIEKFITEEEKFKQCNLIFPSKYKVFNCFNACSFDDVKVVIIGQDPYHSLINQAQGFSFLVPKEMSKYPPSLLNIIKEVRSDTGAECNNLESWVSQGVILMNASLTVKKSDAGCHMKYWETLTNELIKEISSRHKRLIFMLWGKFAQSKEEFIDKTKGHSILKASHPSPLAGGKGWFGCAHFSQANKILLENKKPQIVWGKPSSSLMIAGTKLIEALKNSDKQVLVPGK